MKKELLTPLKIRIPTEGKKLIIIKAHQLKGWLDIGHVNTILLNSFNYEDMKKQCKQYNEENPATRFNLMMATKIVIDDKLEDDEVGILHSEVDGELKEMIDGWGEKFESLKRTS